MALAAEGQPDDTDEEALEADALNELITLSAESQAPLDRLEHRLLPWTTFVIVPIFALANAGVRVGWDDLTDAFSESVTLGVLLGLVIGKPVGIMLFSVLAIRLGIGKQPAGRRGRRFSVLPCSAASASRSRCS